jgi:two-component system, cell cycle response regulator
VPVDASFTGWVVTNGKSRHTADPYSDPFVHTSSRPYLGSSPLAAAPLIYHTVPLGAISCIGRTPFNDDDLALLGAFADQAAVAIENARLFQQVHQLSLTDPLTGLANRRQLERDLVREFAAARRGRRLIAIMFDLNGFKDFNDRNGHLAGDEALRVFGDALSAETRAMNMAFRYGGDEFLVLLADSEIQGAEIFVERVRHRFPGADADEQRRELGVAAGYAEFVQTMRTPEELIAAADRALYQDKSEFHRRSLSV